MAAAGKTVTINHGSTIIFIDNRIVPTDDVATEASFAAYFRSAERLVQQFLAYSELHPSWLRPPRALIIAASCDRTQLIKIPVTHANIGALIEARFYNPMRGIQQTWSKYLVDGLTTVKPFTNSNESLRVIIFTVAEAAMFADEVHEQSLVESVKFFADAVNQLGLQSTNITIACVPLREMKTTMLQNQALLIERTLRRTLNPGHCSTGRNIFTLLINSPLYFDEQLRTMITDCCPKRIVQLKFPSLDGQECSLAVELRAPTVYAADTLAAEMSDGHLFSVSSRDGINPVCLHGCGVTVRAAAQVNGIPDTLR
jgi:hypothetical protein